MRIDFARKIVGYLSFLKKKKHQQQINYGKHETGRSFSCFYVWTEKENCLLFLT